MEKVHLSKEDAARIIAAQNQHTIALKEVTIAQLQADVIHKTALLIVQDIAHQMGISAPNLQFGEDGQPYFQLAKPIKPNPSMAWYTAGDINTDMSAVAQDIDEIRRERLKAAIDPCPSADYKEQLIEAILPVGELANAKSND